MPKYVIDLDFLYECVEKESRFVATMLQKMLILGVLAHFCVPVEFPRILTTVDEM